MKQSWTEDDLAASWLLLPGEWQIIESKRGVTQLGFALLFKFFQIEGRFPSGSQEVPSDAVQFVAQQVGVDPNTWKYYPWRGRSVEYHRASIRQYLGFREATVADTEALKAWLIDGILNHEHRLERLRDSILDRCRTLHIEPPTQKQLLRLLRSALQEHETRFCNNIFQSLDSATLERLDDLLEVKPSEEDEGEWTIWQSLKAEPGKAGLDSVKKAASRLNLLGKVGFTADLFKDVPPKLLERYAKRAAVEQPFELRRHAGSLKVTLMSAFLHRRGEDLTDHLVDLLVETVHKMGKKAERRIEAGLGEALQKAAGKMAKLYRMAKAAVDAPKGTIEEVIFPAAPEKWLLTLIQEVEKRSGYKEKLRTSLQRSYRYHYRRMVPELLNTMEFRCTNARHQPVMQAIAVLKSNLNHKGSSYPEGVQAPLKGVVPSDWMPLVIDKEGEPEKINRVAYELCVLKALRERLRCREIWVAGSRRYRNPEEDLPQDFEDRKAAYYENLGCWITRCPPIPG
jgi:hypothetical protein